MASAYDEIYGESVAEEREAVIKELEQEIAKLQRSIELIESGHLGTSTDQPIFRVLIGKLQATQKALGIVKYR
tara:strand:- start:191 stop:409 length:219 start_codon:yes stop_codon:yes gene_type:complete